MTYLSVLPFEKWNKSTVLGKIFHDVIETTFYQAFRKQVAPLSVTMPTLLTDLNAWECIKIDDEVIELTTPSADVRRYFEELGYPVTGHIALSDWRNMILRGITPDKPVTRKAMRAGRKSTVRITLPPDEKGKAKAHAKAGEEERKAKEREAGEERGVQERKARNASREAAASLKNMVSEE